MRKLGGVEGRVEGSQYSEDYSVMKGDFMNLKKDNEALRTMLTGN